MESIKHQYVLWGLEKCNVIIDSIIKELNLVNAADRLFDIRLLLIEALTNAFRHGNNCSIEKPIFLYCLREQSVVRFEIEDSGNGVDEINLVKPLTDEKLLDEGGRGVFLINEISDYCYWDKNKIVIEVAIKV